MFANFQLKVTTDLFFDRPKIIAAMDRKEVRVLGGTGAAVRAAVRRSMKSGGKKYNTSKPGQPPRYHRDNPLLRDRTFFVYDQARGVVVVGPEQIKTSRVQPVGQTIPQMLEEGGTARIRYPYKSKKTGRYLARYPARPYIAPQTEYGAKVMAEKMKTVPLA